MNSGYDLYINVGFALVALVLLGNGLWAYRQSKQVKQNILVKRVAK